MGAGVMDEEQLIDAVVHVRASKEGATAADVHATLVADGHAELTLSQVKKACSKAGKRQGKAGAAPAALAPVDATNYTKKELKAAKAAESAMKAAETHMMAANRTLRLAMGEDEMMAAVATAERGEKFIQMVTQRALEAKLTPGEALVPRERLAADLATLEWMTLAEKAGTLTLPEDAQTSAASQIERLKRVRETPAFHADKTWVSECFVLPEAAAGELDAPPFQKPSGIDYTANSGVVARENVGASLDRAVAKAGMLSIGGGFDDDID